MKSRLFGRKKDKGGAAQENPYAQQPAPQDIYRPSPSSSVAGGLPSGPGPRRDNSSSPAQSVQSYGGSTYAGGSFSTQGGGGPAPGYGEDKYGSGAGYGNNRFGENVPAYSSNQAAAPPARAGGYGGLGGQPSDEPNRYGSFASQSSNRPPPGRQGSQPGEVTDRYTGLGAGANPNQGYNAQYNDEDDDYADADLTPEQQEERQLKMVTQKANKVRQDNKESLMRSIALGKESYQIGQNTAAALESQGERLNQAHLKISQSDAHTKKAAVGVNELKRLDRNFIASTLTTGKKFRNQQADQLLETGRHERADREAIQAANIQTRSEMARFNQQQDAKRRNQQQSKYAFDSDDDVDEEEHGLMEELTDVVGGLKIQAQGFGRQIQAQDNTLTAMTDRTDVVTDKVAKNTARLREFK